jgi:hypothetical protein
MYCQGFFKSWHIIMKNHFFKFIGVSCLVFQFSILQAQNNVGIGTNAPNPKSLLELSATDKGFLVTRLTTAQRLAINPAGNADAALLVYDNDDSLFYFWNSAQWVPFPQQGGSNNISLNFNANTGLLSITDAGGTLNTDLSSLSNDWKLVGNSGTNPAINFLGTTDNQDLVFRTNNTEKVRVLSNGNVGIGTASPNALLHVSAPSTTAPSLIWNAASGQILRNENSELAIGLSNASPFPFYLQARTNTNTGRDLAINPLGGNVGIGTSAPSAKLEVFGGGIHTVNNDYSVNNAFAYSSGAGHPVFMGVRGEGTFTAPSYPTSGKLLSTFIGRDALDYLNPSSYGGASIYMETTENFSFTNKGTCIRFRTTSNGSNIETERMIIQHDGRVGIGTANPQARLHVVGPVLNAAGNGRRFGFNLPEGPTASAPSTVAYFEGDVLASLGFYAINNPNFSDERIKKVIGVTNNEKDAELISRIQITDYRLIDTLSFGNRVIKKVIAQQVEQVIPEAIYEKTNFIPSVFALSERLTVSKANLLEIKLPKVHGFKEQDRIQINLPNGRQYFTTVQKVLTARSFAIENTSDLQNMEEVLVYGKEIHDFKSVDYDALTTLNISTSQYLLKKVHELENENALIKASSNKSIEELRSEIELLKKANSIVLGHSKKE